MSPRTLFIGAATALALTTTACDRPLSPSQDHLADRATVAHFARHDVDLGPCPALAAPSGALVSSVIYARGTQDYMWDGNAWLFVGPTAELFASRTFRGLVGTHYAGPTWVSVSGSGVVGRVENRCTASPTSIPWLLLSAVSSRGPGIFEGTTHIQRLRTQGGLAPVAPGTAYGQMARVPYTAEYVFYR